jgi:hypothetical protein
LNVEEEAEERKAISLKDVPPSPGFVSVASKGFSWPVSLLFATVAAGFVSVAAKEVTAAGESERRILRTLGRAPPPTIFGTM